MADAGLEVIAGWLRGAQQVVVLTGAGISTESGIPDFRGPQGIWTKDPGAERRANIAHYIASADVRRQAWRDRVERPLWNAEPNAGHRALAELEQRVALHTLVTQNVDGLHQRAGSSPEIVIEIHGTVHEAKCLDCGWRGPMSATLDRVRAGEEEPPCLECGGMLKSATISFGENLVAADLVRAQSAAADCDVFLAIGTSLGVYPAAALPELALANNAKLVILNAEPTPFDDYADATVGEQLGRVLPAIVAAV
ncbi:MAG: Sir2 family NAD-dependent protein deacetylase [Acidimicrobiia bacterium]